MSKRLVSAASAVLASLWLTGFAAADEPAARVPLPAGLASVWRVDGRKADAGGGAWAYASFSTDGKLVGIADDGGVRVYRARDGVLVRMFPAPFSTGQFAYSLALSSTGLVAVGRVGGVEIHSLERTGEPLQVHCGGVCGPVSALAFSPDGAWLASQAARSAREPADGLVNVVDVRARLRSAQLAASSTRAGVLFARDGRTLVAANLTHIDGSGTFGVRRFDAAAGWRRTRDVVGAQVPEGSIGPFAFDERAAAYSRDGNIELRDVATGALVWAQRLVPPGLSSADGAAMKLDLVVLASDWLLSYEAPLSRQGPGALVLRDSADGSVVAMYDVVGVNAIAVAPDGASFVYSTGVGRTYTALARMPR